MNSPTKGEKMNSYRYSKHCCCAHRYEAPSTPRFAEFQLGGLEDGQAFVYRGEVFIASHADRAAGTKRVCVNIKTGGSRWLDVVCCVTKVTLTATVSG